MYDNVISGKKATSEENDINDFDEKRNTQKDIYIDNSYAATQ